MNGTEQLNTLDSLTPAPPNGATHSYVSHSRTPIGLAVLLAVPLVLVNVSAVIGQTGYFLNALHMGLPVALGVSLAMESVAVYLAAAAHSALLAGQSSALLRLGSYVTALLAAGLNYTHYVGTSQAAGITFAALSTVSPWLWSTWSRARHRDQLSALGQVDQRGVKLSLNRKFWAPWRSLAVMRHAAWSGQTDPRLAVAEWEASRETVPVVQVVQADQAETDTDDHQTVPQAGYRLRQSLHSITRGDVPPAPQDYSTELAAAGTDAQRSRIARRITGLDSPTKLAEWLAEQGYTVTVPAIRSGLRRDEDGPPTGPQPRVVTSMNGQHIAG